MEIVINLTDEVKEQFKNNQFRWLVTGCAGFIGSNLVEFLLRNNQFVVGLDNFSTGYSKNLKEIQNSIDKKLFKNFKFYKGDIRNIKDCQKVIKNIDFVLHQAALGSVPRSIKDPLNSHLSNVDGFLNMLVVSNNQNVKNFVYASSSSVYGDHLVLPKKEENIGRPLSPYAATKLINEIYADVFFKNYGLNNIGLRYFNVFGQRQDPNGAYAAVIPLWISNLINNNPIYINGDGETSRDFCYIANVIQANILAALNKKKEAFNQVFNVALNDNNTLNKLFNMIKKEIILNYPELKDIKPIYRDFRTGDIKHSQADISKISNLLGYNPSHKIEEGLKESILWYIKLFKE